MRLLLLFSLICFTGCKNISKEEKQNVNSYYLNFTSEKSEKFKLSNNIKVIQLNIISKDTNCIKRINSKNNMNTLNILNDKDKKKKL